MKMNKKQARAQKAAWQAALIEGRIVRWNENTMTSYPTIEMRDTAIAKNAAGGINGQILGVR
jgi:hypothetical protein